MTLAEAEKKFCISIDALKQYVSFGFIQAKQSENGVEDYREQDFDWTCSPPETAHSSAANKAASYRRNP